MILNSVWGYEFFPNTRTVDAHVVKLRQKLEPDSNTPRHFLTVHGVGYRFVPVNAIYRLSPHPDDSIPFRMRDNSRNALPS